MGSHCVWDPSGHVSKRPHSEGIAALQPPSAFAGFAAARTSMAVIFASTLLQAAPWTGYFIPAKDLAATKRALARLGASMVWGQGWSQAPFGQVPRRSETTPLHSAPNRPHPLLGSSALGGGLRGMCVWGPFRAMRDDCSDGMRGTERAYGLMVSPKATW